MEISRAFFMALTTTCKSFLDLLQAPAEIPIQLVASPTPIRRRGSNIPAGNGNASANAPVSVATAPTEPSVEDNLALKTMMNMLVHWGHLQMELFTAAFARQVQVGSSDKCESVIEHYRMVSDTLGLAHHYTPTASKAGNASVGGNALLPRGMSRPSPTRPADGSASDNAPVRKMIPGPLTFVANCVHVAHEDAVGIMDSQLHMQGAASLSWLLLPDIRKWVHAFADELVKEIYVQIRQEEWFAVSDIGLEVEKPTIKSATDSGETKSTKSTDGSMQIEIPDMTTQTASLSYAWLVMILNNFINESWILLNFCRVMTENAKTSSHSGSPPLLPSPTHGSSEVTSYSRADLSEVSLCSVLYCTVLYCTVLL